MQTGQGPGRTLGHRVEKSEHGSRPGDPAWIRASAGALVVAKMLTNVKIIIALIVFISSSNPIV